MKKYRSPWLFLLPAVAIAAIALPMRRALPRGESAADRSSTWDDQPGVTGWMQVGGETMAQDEVLVELEDWAGLSIFETGIEQVGGTIIGGIPARRCVRVFLPGIGEEVNKHILQSVRALGGVSRVEWNARGEGGQLDPDDTFFPKQWHLRNAGENGATAGADIEIMPAWNIQVGEAATKVAILDTGLDAGHPEFAGRTAPGWDFVNEDSTPNSDHPHGVFVAALLGANTNNFFGVAGVDRTCTLLPIKVLNEQNQGTLFDLLQGLDWCEANGVDVVNLSLVDYPPSPMLQDALFATREAGSVLVACAGNSGLGDADASWPGASPDTISIGFTDQNDRRDPSSATGVALDFVAPGASLYTASSSYVNTYTQFTGCSAATSIASGVVSLLLAEFPYLSQADVVSYLQQGAEDLVGSAGEDSAGRDDFYGLGRLSAMGALSALCSCDGSESLRASPPTIEGAIGGRQIMRLNAGSTYAGRLYWLFGNYTGTVPGINVAGLNLPLNWDGYLQHTLVHPNAAPLTGSLGFLDGSGKAQVELQLLGLNALPMVGLVLNHAYFVFDGPNFLFASQAASATIR